MKNIKHTLILLMAFLLFKFSYADVPPNYKKPNLNELKSVNASGGCAPAINTTNLELNNVRALINTGGDMWWDMFGDQTAKYEVPKGSGKTSLFAGSIWIGGIDVNGQLKLAAQRFRSEGKSDYWTGPLIPEGDEIATVDKQICRRYDKHFSISRDDVSKFKAWYEADNETKARDYPGYSIPQSIIDWPGNGPAGYDPLLAPFKDRNGDMEYNPEDGDYPYYDLDNDIDPNCERPKNKPRIIFGDETLWWVYNDKGNIHTETGADAIGMEIKAQAFAFATSDELNDMTFYNYNVINRSTYTLTNTYFGVWTDADLGFATDDYVGCDVDRGLGYIYNGAEIDGNGEVEAYGKNPPSCGIDFFEGPYQDNNGEDDSTVWKKNGRDKNCNAEFYSNGSINGLNFGDGTIDNERWGMRRFVYFNNDNSNTGDPKTAQQHYNYLLGKWKNGVDLSYGGAGDPSNDEDDAVLDDIKTDFMFPGETDECDWGTKKSLAEGMEIWTEETAKNDNGDRRFVQSAGPFTLEPGAVNDITIGAVWARATSGDPFESVKLMQRADDKAQRLFESCFKILDGPDAPKLTIIELDKEFIFHISNPAGSNNYLEGYSQKDERIELISDTITDYDTLVIDGKITAEERDSILEEMKKYKFQGYQVYQVKDGNVSVTELENTSVARIIFQCDIKDEASTLVNLEDGKALVEKVNGANNGIVHSFKITEDFFAQGDNRLVNYKDYHYIAVAYAYNNYAPYKIDVNYLSGQYTPYLLGRKSTTGEIRSIKHTPHPNSSLDNGTFMNAEYGDMPAITKLSGNGNGGLALDLEEVSENEIFNKNGDNVEKLSYKRNNGPINIKVIDPLSVPKGKFILKMDTITSFDTITGKIKDAKWSITNGEKTIKSDNWISIGDEQLIPEWGISISIKQIDFPLFGRNENGNGFIEASIEYEDDKTWLVFFPDNDEVDELDWIKAGNNSMKIGRITRRLDYCFGSASGNPEESYRAWFDENADFEKILGGTWAPYWLCKGFDKSNKYPLMNNTNEQLSNFQTNGFEDLHRRLSSIDFVITADKSKWTRSPIIEMIEPETGSSFTLEDGTKVNSFGLKNFPSVDKEGNPDNTETNGMGWFPGYAIDIESGERLNIMFGEDSQLVGDNGRDMIWNPTSNLASLSEMKFGGKHYIYVMGPNDGEFPMPAYDEGEYIRQELSADPFASGYVTHMKNVFMNPMWVSIPLLNPEYDFQETDDPYGFIEGDVKVKIRVANPYVKNTDTLSVDTEANNNNFPMFEFYSDDICVEKGKTSIEESAMDKINVVPNPYYGYSEYEKGQLENEIKIINLPNECEISIYSANGTLIKKFKKDNFLTYQKWDMKNTYGIPISSGVYIIHISSDAGEKILKWFGALRPIDLNAF